MAVQGIDQAGYTDQPVAPHQLVAVTGASARQARRRRRRVLALDAAVLTVGAVVATVASEVALVGSDGRLWSMRVPLAAVFVVTALVAIDARGLYEHRIGAEPLDDLGRIASGTAIAAMALITASVVLGGDLGATSHTARLWAFGTIYLGAGRAGLNLATRRALRNGDGGAPTLVVGAGSVGQRLAERLLDRPEHGLRPIGFLDKEPRRELVEEGRLPVLGASWDLERIAAEHDVRHVVVTFSTAPHEVLLDLTKRCMRLGIEVSIVPRLFEQLTRRLTVEHIGGIPLVRAGQVDPKGWQFDVKYALDRFISALVLLALSPFMLAVALGVKLTSPGPVLHRQRRVGLDGREFTLLKFRSMTGSPRTDGEADAAWIASVAGAPPAAVEEVVDRRTPLGRVLRRTSLDELPQLLNVLRGDMSLVGPRPERVNAVRAVEQHVYRYGDRHRVKSGLTGWAQVHGLRGQTSLDDRVEWDNYYIENWSFWLDLKIVAMTVPALLGGAGAE